MPLGNTTPYNYPENMGGFEKWPEVAPSKQNYADHLWLRIAIKDIKLDP